MNLIIIILLIAIIFLFKIFFYKNELFIINNLNKYDNIPVILVDANSEIKFPYKQNNLVYDDNKLYFDNTDKTFFDVIITSRFCPLKLFNSNNYLIVDSDNLINKINYDYIPFTESYVLIYDNIRKIIYYKNKDNITSYLNINYYDKVNFTQNFDNASKIYIKL